MFDVGRRGAVRQQLVKHAQEDDWITGCALLGSAARGEEDSWSDIDLALQLAQPAVLEVVVDDWTQWLTTNLDVADTLDVRSGDALYRVFLLADSMQVDLSFWPHESFRSTGEPIKVIFGQANPADPAASADASQHIRMGWLYALHARSAIARGRHWQADMMVAQLREQVMAMVSVRLGLNPAHGREAHLLPPALLTRLAAARATELSTAELFRSLRATLGVYRTEVAHHDQKLAHALAAPLNALEAPHT